MLSTAFVLVLTLKTVVYAERPSCAVIFPQYGQAVLNAHLHEALHDLLDELHVTPEEAAAIVIQPGLHLRNDNRMAEAEPVSMRIHVDPQLFDEGASGACQDLAHELAHFRHFQKDREALHMVFAKSTPTTGWKGCDDFEKNVDKATQEEDAFECLQDNDLITHNAAYEIEGVLAQAAVAQEVLRSEDYDYLVNYLTRYNSAHVLILDHANEAYYLPSMKKEDETIKKAGDAYVASTSERRASP